LIDEPEEDIEEIQLDVRRPGRDSPITLQVHWDDPHKRVVVERVEGGHETEAGSTSRMERLRRVRDSVLGYGGEEPLTAGELREILSLTTVAGVWDRHKQGRLLALQTGPRSYRFPTWQFDDIRPGQLVQDLEGILAAMPVDDSWGLAGILTHPQPSLGGQRPIDLLRAGGRTARDAAVRVKALLEDTYGELSLDGKTQKGELATHPRQARSRQRSISAIVR
jgi:hypothetical protein